jgi:hypothetical protein
VAGKARRQRRDHQRHRNADQRRRHDHCEADAAEHAPGKGRGCNRAIVVPDAQIGRHQRGIQRTLGQRSPEDADALKRHQECIRHRPRAEQRRHHGVARKSQQPRGERSGGDGEEGADHAGIL